MCKVSGSDGNGYYGSGYRINVIAPVREQEENYDYGERINENNKFGFQYW